MADYYPLLKRAIGSLVQPDERMRYDVYERARRALLRQLEASGVPEAEVNLQLKAIGAAIARIESEIAEISEPPPPIALRSARPRHESPPPESQFEPSADAAAVLRRRPTALFVVAGVLVGIVLAGLSYYFVIHDRTRPAPAPRADAARPAPQPTAGPPTVASDVDTASYMLRRQRIFYRTTHPPGTIIVSRSQRFLYLVQPNQVAIRYAIGTGPECENTVGLFHVTEKLSVAPKDPAAVPTATPPPPFRLGEQFGPRAVYFDSTHAVHGTAQPHQIGQSAPAGCFLSWAPDIVDLYDRVQLNDRVVVAN